MSWGSPTLTPGRVVALTGLLAGVVGLYFGALGPGEGPSPSQWELLGSMQRGVVVGAAALMIAAAFRPAAPGYLDLAGAFVEAGLGVGAVAFAVGRLEAAARAADTSVRSRGFAPLVVAAAAVVLLAGAVWDLVVTVRSTQASRAGSEEPGAPRETAGTKAAPEREVAVTGARSRDAG